MELGVVVVLIALIWILPVQVVYAGEKESGRDRYGWLAAPLCCGWLGWLIWRVSRPRPVHRDEIG